MSEQSGSAPDSASTVVGGAVVVGAVGVGAVGVGEAVAVPRSDTLVEASRLGSGIGTIYEALDRLVDLYALDDAVLVVDVPSLGRQVLRAGRRPLHDDERGLLRSPPGLYLDPPLHDPVLDELMLAVGALGLRFDARAGAGS